MAALMAVAGFASVASAHQVSDEHGTVTIHDEPNEEATVEVSDCDFFIRVQDLTHSEGTWEIRIGGLNPPSSITIREGTWNATPDGEGGLETLIGPIEFDRDQVSLTAWLMMGEHAEHEFPPHGTASDFFDVECEEEQPPHEDEQERPCNFDLTAEAREDESILLTWEQREVVEVSLLRNGEGIADLSPENTTFVDENVEAGETYTYTVSMLYPRGGGPSCTVEVTAIPFFPNPVVATLATIGVAGTVFALRRKA